MNSFFKKNKKINKISGFTLIELLLVTAIFGIITAIVVFNYGDFTDRVISTNMAYEIALTVRQAQAYGLGVRGSGGNFDDSYGVFIHLPEGGTKNMAFFRDDNSNQLCDGDGSYCICAASNDECIEQLTLQRNIKIVQLQGRSSGVCSDIENLSVSFKRPNPDALIKNHDSLSTVYELVEIGIRAPRSNAMRYVVIRNTGQISVTEDSNCPIALTGGEGDGDPPPEQQQNVLGCTDPDANNFNPNATQDDGSCTYDGDQDVSGCTDLLANNYNPNATQDDGSCTYDGNQDVFGCTDPLANNYDPNATSDDGSCTYDNQEMFGCTDPSANNYDVSATSDDGSCTYSSEPGCTDSSAINYNPSATEDDGSCSYEIYGCTDSGAINYNFYATVDDGSCEY